MFKKIKVYLNHVDSSKKYKSFLDEMDRFEEFSRKIKLNATKDLAFMSILKLVTIGTKDNFSFLDLNEGDLLEYKKKKDGPKKWTVLEKNLKTLSFSLESKVSEDHKIWIGFKFLKEKKGKSTFRYFEGFMTPKINIGLPKIFSEMNTKKELKIKSIKIENKINRSLNGIR